MIKWTLSFNYFFLSQFRIKLIQEILKVSCPRPEGIIIHLQLPELFRSQVL